MPIKKQNRKKCLKKMENEKDSKTQMEKQKLEPKRHAQWYEHFTVQYWTDLYHIVQYCTILLRTVQYWTFLYIPVQYFDFPCGTVQYCRILCGSEEFCILLYSPVQYCTALYGTARLRFTSSVQRCIELFSSIFFSSIFCREFGLWLLGGIFFWVFSEQSRSFFIFQGLNSDFRA